MTSSSLLVKELADALAGYAKQVFGLMGNGNAHLIDELLKRDCIYTAVRHEAGTVAAADAYTRVSGELAIATTTYGAGFTNALTALAEAVKARVPMIVVVGDEPAGFVRDIDVDQEMLTVALGTRNYRLSRGDITRTVQKAVRYALQVRKPVVIGIPYDLTKANAAETGADRAAGQAHSAQFASAAEEGLASATGSADSTVLSLDDPGLMAAMTSAVMGEDVQPAAQPKTNPINTHTVSFQVPAVNPDSVSAALDVLAKAKKPLVLVGRGTMLANAQEEAQEVAHTLGAATASTALGRGIFYGKDFDLGVTGGFGAEKAMDLVHEADTVLVVGASLNQFTMRFGDLFGAGTNVIRVDIDPHDAPQTNNEITHLLLQGDAKETLKQLLDGLKQKGHAPATWRQEIAALPGEALLRETGAAEYPGGICADGLLDPRQVATKLAELLPEDIHITQDGGHFIGWANMFWPVSSPERMTMVGTAYQTIGLGFPSAVGVAKAAPESTVVLSTGDGGGLMALADFETAVREAESLIIVVWNDGAYGAEIHLYGEMGLNKDPMWIPRVDFAAVARGFGAEGVSVQKIEDLEALADWKARGAKGTILLDCAVSPTVMAPYQEEIQRVNGL